MMHDELVGDHHGACSGANSAGTAKQVLDHFLLIN